MTVQVINGVKNYYGPKGRFEANAGALKTSGMVKEGVVVFAGDNYSLVSFKLPAGAYIVDKPTVEVIEAFNLGGTTPTINIGVSGSHGTNYLAEISEAQAEAIGTYVSAAPAGTLAVDTPLASEATIVVALDGTNPTATGAGLCKVVFRYKVV